VRCRRIGRKPLYAREDLDEYMNVTVEDAPAVRRPSKRRGSAHATTRQNPKAKELAEHLERRAHGG
jgi:hypothetical protein